MIAKAIETILELKRPDSVEVDGRPYILGGYEQVKTPRPKIITIHSLESMVDYILINKDGLNFDEYMIHVVSPGQVALISKTEPRYKQRSTPLVAALPEDYNSFPFDEKLSSEKFIIKIMTCFEETKESMDLMEIAASVTDSSADTISDDGISQEFTKQSGVAVKQKAKIKNPMKLRPFRTFAEIKQPTSNFIFRLHKGYDEPQMALYLADIGTWKIEAIGSIKTYFAERLKKTTIGIIG